MNTAPNIPEPKLARDTQRFVLQDRHDSSEYCIDRMKKHKFESGQSQDEDFRSAMSKLLLTNYAKVR